jgi:glycosyltransferase involved in cell wall biosynthesis
MLKESIGSVVDQLSPDTEALVEIVVSDNASPDGTQAEVARMIEAYPGMAITYHRRRENIGADGNVLGVVGLATGRYCMILSDDDILCDGALDTIIVALRASVPPDVLCCNMAPLDRSGEVDNPVHDITGDTALQGKDAVLDYLGVWVTFLSTIVFRRDLLSIEGFDKYYGTSLSPCYYFLAVIAKAQTSIALAKVIVAIRANNTGGYSFFDVFVTGFDKLVNYAAQIGYDASVVGRLKDRNLTQLVLPLLLQVKRHGGYGALRLGYFDGARRLIAHYPASRFMWLVVLPCLFTPAPILNALLGARSAAKRLLHR